MCGTNSGIHNDFCGERGIGPEGYSAGSFLFSGVGNPFLVGCPGYRLGYNDIEEIQQSHAYGRDCDGCDPGYCRDSAFHGFFQYFGEFRALL